MLYIVLIFFNSVSVCQGDRFNPCLSDGGICNCLIRHHGIFFFFSFNLIRLEWKPLLIRLRNHTWCIIGAGEVFVTHAALQKQNYIFCELIQLPIYLILFHHDFCSGCAQVYGDGVLNLILHLSPTASYMKAPKRL